MIYTLGHGAQNHMKRQHYSLYGGVEEVPRNLPIPGLKQLLPRIAAPGAFLAIMAVLLSSHTFHSGSKSQGGSSTQIVRPSAQNTQTSGHSGSSHNSPAPASSNGAAAGSTSTPTAASTAPATSVSSTAASALSPVTGLVGGYGSVPTSGTSTSVGTGSTGATVSTGGTTGTYSTNLNTPVSQTSLSASASPPAVNTSTTVSVPGTNVTKTVTGSLVDP